MYQRDAGLLSRGCAGYNVPDMEEKGHVQTDGRRSGVVTCFLEHRDKILVLCRSREARTYRGKWAGVSGSVDGPSALEQALKEIREETGLEEGELELLAEGDILEVLDEGLGVRWMIHPFLFRVTDPARIRLDWEHVEARWIDPHELAVLDTVPGLKETWERVACPKRLLEG